MSTFRGVFLIQFYPLEITQREIKFEIEACEHQGKDYYVKTPPTILVNITYLSSFFPTLGPLETLTLKGKDYKMYRCSSH